MHFLLEVPTPATVFLCWPLCVSIQQYDVTVNFKVSPLTVNSEVVVVGIINTSAARETVSRASGGSALS